ncbi:MAG: YbaB/EbfC family nucleoid-associated protein [Helicobacteraceae bacterium]|jgi:DNA-binding YbaB/EbfC family protein|nr:YbaB/EbfC family nucleoid-associated protein [Helicobacteraceae bacterium]
MFENLNLGNLGELIAQAQQQAREMQEDAEAATYAAKSGGGLIKIVANGNGEIVDLEIDDSLLTDKQSLIILLIAAFNEVTDKINEGRQQAAMQMMGNIAASMQK